jgi:hypothetical protein
MESETDASITKLVGEELKKLGEQINTTGKVFDKKLIKLQQDMDLDKINKNLTGKMGKDEAKSTFDNYESRIIMIEKN